MTDTLAKRARSKWLNNSYLYDLIDLNTPLKQSYWNTYHCANILIQQDEKITAKYCGNRWCHVCNRIRTAKAIKGYLPQIEQLQDPWFVTLTVPNVKRGLLEPTLVKMGSRWRHIYKNALKGRKMAVTGLRKVECTYNPLRRDYHPHYHFLVEGHDTAFLMRLNWMMCFRNASPAAQDIRPATTGSTFELFKYHTKIFTDRKIYPEALDTIFHAFRGQRVFQPFGMKKVSEEIDDISATISADVDEKIWKWFESDWVDEETGECLTGFEPSEVLKFLLEKK